MLFKVRDDQGEWWMEDNNDLSPTECGAFVFDSENVSHMEEVRKDFIRAGNIIKVVNKVK